MLVDCSVVEKVENWENSTVVRLADAMDEHLVAMMAALMVGQKAEKMDVRTVVEQADYLVARMGTNQAD